MDKAPRPQALLHGFESHRGTRITNKLYPNMSSVLKSTRQFDPFHHHPTPCQPPFFHPPSHRRRVLVVSTSRDCHPPHPHPSARVDVAVLDLWMRAAFGADVVPSSAKSRRAAARGPSGLRTARNNVSASLPPQGCGTPASEVVLATGRLARGRERGVA